MPIGQAVEMNEHTGSLQSSTSPTYESQQQNYGLRDSDADVTGMVGLQTMGLEPERRGSPMRMDSMERRSPTSIYSSEQ